MREKVCRRSIFTAVRSSLPDHLLVVGIVAIFSGLLYGCYSKSLSTNASVEITEVPPADPGGPVQMGFIGGRVTHAKADESVVIYAHSGIWWIQPFANDTFTKLQPDATWRNATHLGADYAALLVEPGYHAPSRLTTLPSLGNGVVAIAVTPGKPGKPLPSQKIQFSGYEWNVDHTAVDRAGQLQQYDPANVWTDDKGFLHLRTQERNGVWSCAEVSLTRSLGYGTYIFVVQDTSQLGPSAAFSLYTRDNFSTVDTPNELDIQLSRWGLATSQNAQYIVQPFYVPENVWRFTAPAGVLTHILHWEPGRASFATVSGATFEPRAAKVAEHTFITNVPTPAKETTHIDLYNYRRTKDSHFKKEEVVIERFEFFP
jgi:hypothetical protein